MKKFYLFFMVTALILTTLISMPVLAESPVGNYGNQGTISNVFIDQDFTGTAPAFNVNDSTLTGLQPFTVPNAGTYTSDNYAWTTRVGSFSGGIWTNYYKATNIDDGNTAIVGGNNIGAQFDCDPIAEDGALLYVDIRLKPNQLNTASGIYVQNSAYKNIFKLDFPTNCYPKVSGSTANTYGGESLVSGESVLTFSGTNDWICVRAIIDLPASTFKMYQGQTWDTLQPILKTGDATLAFNSSITPNYDLGRIKTVSSGGMSFDEIKIYSVTAGAPPRKPIASNITIAGKPNIGATLTASYGAYFDPENITEGESYGYWESCNTSAFSNSTKITANTLITAGNTNEYVLSETEKGKYVRFCVVPINEEGTAGDAVYSNACAHPVGIINYTLDIPYNIISANKVETRAMVNIINTSNEPVTGILICAWYRDDELTDIRTIPVLSLAGSSSGTGIVNESFNTPTKDINPADVEGLIIKAFLWDGLNTIRPLIPSTSN